MADPILLKAKRGGRTRRLLAKKLAQLALDRKSGAGEMALDVVSFLVSACRKNRPFSEALLLDILLFSQGLRLVQPAMAPLVNISLAITTLARRARLKAGAFEPRFMSYLEKQQRSLRGGTRRLAAHGARKMPKGCSVMTISRSSEVFALFVAAKKKVAKVYALRSLPGGEGAGLARQLKRAGVVVELVEDSKAAGALKNCDLVLIGADAVCEDCVVNKIGSRRLARFAVRRKLPLWVAATSFKVIGSNDYAFRGGKLFERVPLNLVSVVVSEKGIRRSEVGSRKRRGGQFSKFPTYSSAN